MLPGRIIKQLKRSKTVQERPEGKPSSSQLIRVIRFLFMSLPSGPVSLRNNNDILEVMVSTSRGKIPVGHQCLMDIPAGLTSLCVAGSGSLAILGLYIGKPCPHWNKLSSKIKNKKQKKQWKSWNLGAK